MKSNKLIKYLLSDALKRIEVLKIPYGDEDTKRKKMEAWINIEMRVKLDELKSKKVIEFCESEHNYDELKEGKKGGLKYPQCDLWWKINDNEHWLENKTLVFHISSKKFKSNYKKRFIDDFKKEKYLHPTDKPYNLHHLCIIFNDKNYNNDVSLEGIYSMYKEYQWDLKDKWAIELDNRYYLNCFIHYKIKNPE